ncbi:MAG TPA: hypothetical protein VF053_07270 [Streptosporangiales bacterium]
MRHFAGLLLGIILLPVFFALNWLVNYTGDHSASTQSRLWLLALLGSFALFGIVLGFCLAARSISPVALLLGGVLIIATDVLLSLPKLAGVQVNLPQLYDHANITRNWLPLVAGFALLFGSFVPARWHRPVRRDEIEEEYDVRGRDLFDDRDESAQTQVTGRYDGSWGSGRNDYADDPEQPYGRSSGDDPERTAVPEPRASGDVEPAYDYQSESARRSG